MHLKTIMGCRLSTNKRLRTCGPPTHLLTHNVVRVRGGKPTKLLVLEEATTFSQILFKLLSFNLKAAMDSNQLLGMVWLLSLTDWFQREKNLWVSVEFTPKEVTKVEWKQKRAICHPLMTLYKPLLEDINYQFPKTSMICGHLYLSGIWQGL